jgi:hypothetical protein
MKNLVGAFEYGTRYLRPTPYSIFLLLLNDITIHNLRNIDWITGNCTMIDKQKE